MILVLRTRPKSGWDVTPLAAKQNPGNLGLLNTDKLTNGGLRHSFSPEAEDAPYVVV